METTYTLPAPDDADALAHDVLEEVLFHVGGLLANRSDADDLVRSAIDVAVCAYSSDMSMAIYDLHDCINTLLDVLEKYR